MIIPPNLEKKWRSYVRARLQTPYGIPLLHSGKPACYSLANFVVCRRLTQFSMHSAIIYACITSYADRFFSEIVSLTDSLPLL